MAVKYSDFILEYYKRKTFRGMPWPQFLQFCDEVKKDNLSGQQKLWAKYFLQQDANGNYIQNPIGGYIQRTMPDPYIAANGENWQLSDEEWAKMFRAFQTAFRGLKSNESKLVDNDKALKFIKKYYGSQAEVAYVFDDIIINPAAKDQINNLRQILTQSNNVVANLYNENRLDNDFTIRDLIDGIDSEKYKKDDAFRRKMFNIVYHLQDVLNSNWDKTLGDEIRNLGLPGLNLSIIYRDFEDTNVAPVRLNNFKGVYASILDELYTTKDVRTAFQAYDTEHIVQKIDDAKTYINYNDPTNNPDDYVGPKKDDELNFRQRVAEWWDNTFEGYLEKYVKLRGDRLFFSDQAKEIAKAFDEVPVKPTDGLAKILESCDKAAEKVKLRKSKNHLKWFKETLAEIKTIMPKAFDGALQHGHQLRAIVSELIMRAVDNNKIDEAKTAMELLSVMKYGMTTSRTMDVLKKQEITIFSDKNLSWNKSSDAMRFVSNAVDYSLRFAMLGIGYGITIAGNAYRLSGSKFNGNRGDILRNRQNADKENAQQNVTALNELARTTITDQENLRDATNITSATDLQNKKNDSQSEQNIIDNLHRLMNGDSIRIERKERQIQNINDKINQINELNQRIQDINNAINDIDVELASSLYHVQPLPQDVADIANELKRNKAAYIIERRKAYSDLANAQSNGTLAQWQRLLRQAQSYHSRYTQDLQQHYADLGNHTRAKETLDNNIAQYESAQNTIAELTRQINNRDAEMQNWDIAHNDKYQELMAYWDMLETGRDSHIGKMYNWLPRSKKSAQAAFDAHKGNLITNYRNNYSIAS